MQDQDKPLTASEIAAASATPVAPRDGILSPAERAALAIDVAWVDWRAALRRKVLASGVLKRAWRSVFEADMIFSIVAHRWLIEQPITHKELASYLEEFATEATVSRHVSDMEEAGMIVRQIDPNDRRRIFLLPTERLETVGREFLQARIRMMRERGFVWLGNEADQKTPIDPA